MTQEQFQNIKTKAEEYIKMGWFIVPVRGKATATSFDSLTTEGVYDSTKFFEILENGKEWITGIGVITGEKSGISVIDLDTYKGISENITNFFKNMGKTPVSRSGRGGYHIFLKYDQRMPNRADVLSSVDVKNNNGMIVLPPSIHENGNQYIWMIDPKDTPLQEVTDDILRLLNSEKVEVKPKDIKPIYQEKEHFNFDDYYPEGMRDDQITRACASLATQMKHRDTMVTFMKSWVKDHVQNWQDFEQNDWKALIVKIDSALRKFSTDDEEKHKNDITIYTGSDIHVAHGNDLFNILAKRRLEIGTGISTGYSDIDSYFTFKNGRLYLLSASTHMGKTTIALSMALKIAKEHKVLFAGLENGLYMLDELSNVSENFNFLWSDGMTTANQLRETIEQLKPEMVFIDHIHFLAKSGKGATEDMDKNIMEMQMLAQKCDIPVFVIAHLRKTEGRVPTLDDLKDSSSLSQVPAVVMFLHRDQNKDTKGEFLSRDGKLIIAKNRLGKTVAGLKYTYEAGQMWFESKPSTVFSLGSR